MNIYIQRATQITSWNISSFRGNIRLMSRFEPPAGYSPTQDERLIYYLNKGGQGPLRGEGKIISTYYREETCGHALKVAEQTQLTIIISIVAIVVVSLIVSPIFCRIEERKYMAVKFFL